MLREGAVRAGVEEFECAGLTEPIVELGGKGVAEEINIAFVVLWLFEAMERAHDFAAEETVADDMYKDGGAIEGMVTVT